MQFPQFREIMKHTTTFIVMPPPLFYLYQLYPIVHYPIIHILRREEHKLLFMHRYRKVPASNKVVHISYACYGYE
jgi:hypothetical protein